MSNIILNADSYKASHYAWYPEGTSAQFAYLSARKPDKTIVPFGLQMAIKKNLLKPIKWEDVIEAEEILTEHGLPFNYAGWERIHDVHGGYLPVTIKAVLEGTPTPSQTPILTVESNDPELYWLPSYIESWLQRDVWYPSTIASNDRENYAILKEVYDETSDNPANLQFALHDFGARGVSSYETAEMGGLAHLIYFRGTDNLASIAASRKYYNCKMPGYSIPATEHSVQCSYGNEKQMVYISSILHYMAKGDIVSIVLDGYDIYRDTEALCSNFVHIIKQSDIKVVIRPDSGNPLVVIPKLLNVIDYWFSHTVNSKGYKVLNNVSLIQGDGIDTSTMQSLARMVKNHGYAAETLVYGSGGGLLQKVNRDTYSFAQKTSAMKINDEWIDTVKNPVTDPGKKSQGGRFEEYQLETYYHNGKLLIDDSLDTIRLRALGGL